MSQEITLFLAQPKELEQRPTVEEIFELFTIRGYTVSDITVGYSAEQFVNYGTDVDTALWHVQAVKAVWLYATHKDSELELDIVIDWSGRERRPFIRIFTHQLMLFIGSDFRPEIDRLLYQATLLGLGKDLYKVTRPIFGFIDGGSTEIAPTDDQLESLELPHLYWANFYGQPFVERIGRQKLLHVSTGLVEEFTDGGFLYRIDQDLIGPNVTDRKRDQMLRYFGLQDSGHN